MKNKELIKQRNKKIFYAFNALAIILLIVTAFVSGNLNLGFQISAGFGFIGAVIFGFLAGKMVFVLDLIAAFAVFVSLLSKQ